MKQAMMAVVMTAALGGQVVAQDTIPQESYLCIGDQSTGFSWEQNQWVQSKFTAASHKFVVTLSKVQKGAFFKSYELKKFEVGGQVSCILVNGEIEIKCGDLNVGFLINQKTLRFHSVYGYGFTGGIDNAGNTPHLTIGTCTRLN